MYLLFDLSEKDMVRLKLFNGSELFVCEENAAGRDLLKILDIFLNKRQLAIAAIKGIMVVVGTGSFSNTRVSVLTANIIAYVNKIPVLGINKAKSENPQVLICELRKRRVGDYISASYSGEANISMPKHIC